MGWCDWKGGVQFFPFAWKGEQGSNYLLHYVLTDNIFVQGWNCADRSMQMGERNLKRAEWRLGLCNRKGGVQFITFGWNGE